MVLYRSSINIKPAIKSLVFGLSLLIVCASQTMAQTTEVSITTAAPPATAAPTTPAPTLAPTPPKTDKTSTTTTTTPTTTTTTVKPTTTVAPTLGDSCTDNSTWCANLTGTVCNNGVCTCDTNHFKFNASTCKPVSDLEPQSLVIDTITTTSLNVRWTMNSSYDSSIFSYAVSATNKDDVSFTGQTCTVTTGGTSLSGNCAGLQPGAKYEVKVEVTFTDQDGIISSQSSMANDSLIPAQPGELLQDLTLSAPNVTLSWKLSTGRVEYYTIKIDGKSNQSTDDSPTYTATELVPGVTYSVEIIAMSYNKPSTARVDSFRTITTEPGPPTGLMIMPGSVKPEVALSWSATTEPNGDIVGYEVCRQSKVYNDMEYGTENCEDRSTNTHFTDSNVTYGTYYQYFVSTINDKYTSTANATGRARTVESVPGQVYNLVARPVNTSVTLTWQRPRAPNGDIIAYRIVWSATEINSSTPTSTCLTNSTGNMAGCSGNSTDISISINQVDLTYFITDLLPHTEYTVNVTAYTEKGPGEVKSTTVMTSVAVPDPVTDVIVDVLNSTTVSVSWTIPTVNPGPVDYTVTTYDSVLNISLNDSATCQVSDYTSSSCEIDGLEEFWKYKFGVVANTSAGSSEKVDSSVITTRTGVPGNISKVDVEYYTLQQGGTCDARKVTIKWWEPNLRDRNTNITSYRFEGSPGLNFPVDTQYPYRYPNKDFTQTFQLAAESQYMWELFAVGFDGKTGGRTSIKATTGACPPPDWTSTDLSEIIENNKATVSTVTIELKMSLFNNQQGRITSKGLVVVPEKSNFFNQDSISDSDLNNVGDWKTSSSSNFQLEYKIDLSTLQPTRTRRSLPSDTSYTIGEDKDCKTDNTPFCNGPLPASLKFKLAIYSCTNITLCRVSSYIGPLVTATPPPPEEASTGWIIAVAFLVVLLALVTSFGFLWYRGIINPKQWFGGSTDKPPDDIEFPDPEKLIPRPKPIKISEYFTVLEDMHRDTNLQFSSQYEDISKLGDIYKERSTINAAKHESNTAKNRWVNILPYDHSRVKLQQIDDDDPTSDYINANYMPGFNMQREYIATQGPLPGTVDDFWRLVWEQNVRVIVMLTQCKEGNRVKCEKYWPDELREPKQYGDVVVNPVSISQLDKYNISIFYVSVNNTTRQVIHFHYLDFPDFSANVEFDHFIEFVRTVRNHVPHDMKEPMIVHCSAGVGRTGTFIGVDRLQLYLNSPQFNENDTVDIFDMVVGMRKNRVFMVQTESQYIMIHDCFEKMLADKKASLQVSDSMENLYANEAFDPYPEVVYENIESSQQRTEL